MGVSTNVMCKKEPLYTDGQIFSERCRTWMQPSDRYASKEKRREEKRRRTKKKEDMKLFVTL